MKLIWKTTVLSIAFAGALLSAAAAITAGNTAAPPPASREIIAQVSSRMSVLAVSSEVPDLQSYLVRSRDGVICVYVNDSLVLKTDIPVSTLPESDRIALQQGIPASDRETLAQLLEDLGS